ncbi:unnamed protein product [Rotaria sp. Silwood2]|nr:unnamed protein product [Rotaria sp. Silwood2]CAF2824429.1 unnamed protein product [Rotaria sp. Silwood2]CAF2985303.1 unnamed protein product [Rotaria sp. Silwood2]CAF4451033.1 unnamed protein product [Rotaria sp. Silwood2]CAF4465576.1 unnamed protein product [Rotaria sp. Silwood2]
MALVPVTTRNRINPMSVSTLEQSTVPYTTYDQVELCADPNCPVCRAQRHDSHHKHHKHHKRHHHHHHHKKHRTDFWNTLLPRGESASSTVTIHSIELDERRPYYSSHVNERAVVPINQTERQVVTTTRPRRIEDDNIVREAWTNNPTSDDEIVCCRAYDGCRCPCWCCIILIILFVILIIVLIVLLATLL